MWLVWVYGCVIFICVLAGVWCVWRGWCEDFLPKAGFAAGSLVVVYIYNPGEWISKK
jgi:hypothetical protein